MTDHFVFRSTTLATAILLFATGDAKAACTIDEASVIPAPGEVLRTMEPRQRFSFDTSGDCRNLLFSVQDTTLTKIPDRVGVTSTYKVFLNQSEWRSVLDESTTTVTWSITAYGPGGHQIAQVTTASEIDFDDDGWTRSDGDVGECDLSSSINPGVEEECNLVDDNCNEEVDDDLCYYDINRRQDLGFSYLCIDGFWEIYSTDKCGFLGYTPRHSRP